MIQERKKERKKERERERERNRGGENRKQTNKQTKRQDVLLPNIEADIVSKLFCIASNTTNYRKMMRTNVRKMKEQLER